ncbi:DNA-directed RNA polymerase subunit alpha [Helicobacter kayseriensis]|uniref:DNA-directed RNA polymerase subunit alpha n=1 Tax=Helicobacter kayseriensis TaxID=2905877 RepID=UPI001E584A77|nr:DNA-directed RNA polymerase subunit alpha [Helicobacter kayseriensis]MCE3047325.1 DNA-directed RNA polymerase subunit alpha [Helicobacter kayseriensis]MCE3048696.1 DNA-directed RNA polymerase subunit alpha [Helicobacter kayseriensis]
MKTIKTSPYVPTDISVEEVGKNRIKITAYPFESGYAITFAHPIRRLLMSSSVGFAPIGFQIDGVAHEFDSIRGIVEDVPQLVVNLKNIQFLIANKESDEPLKLSYSFKGPKNLQASHFISEGVEVTNPELHIATINEGAELNMTLLVQNGIGYVPSEDIRGTLPEGFIPLDAFFTPVKRVTYDIDSVLVEDNPNFEKIIFDIETNGQIEPMQAFRNAIMIMHEQMSVFGADLSLEAPAFSSKSGNEDSAELKNLLIRIDSLNLSARCFNCLDRAEIRYIGELVMMEESALKNIKNLGKKSYDEITEKMEELGYPVGTKLSENLIALFEKKINKK